MGKYVFLIFFGSIAGGGHPGNARQQKPLQHYLERTVTSFHSILGGIIPMNKLSVYYRMKFSENNRFPW